MQTSERALAKLGVNQAVVPPTFPVGLADRLRAQGVELTPDREFFAERRRVKSEVGLAGIRRAQKGTEAGMAAAAEMLRSAEASNGSVVLDGEPLTSERLKARITEVFNEHDLVSDEMIVAIGGQAASGHDMGSGPIPPGRGDRHRPLPARPRERLLRRHDPHVRRRRHSGGAGGVPPPRLRGAAESLAEVKGGAEGRAIFQSVCDVFHEAGHPTQLSKQPGEVLANGFFHGLGHGVGLEVHEPPSLSRDPSQLKAGDVVTLEPGLYREGWGGVRLEDLVLVTEDGCENLTKYPLRPDP